MARFFHSVETFFPLCGKIHKIFSIVWKTFGATPPEKFAGRSSVWFFGSRRLPSGLLCCPPLARVSSRVGIRRKTEPEKDSRHFRFCVIAELVAPESTTFTKRANCERRAYWARFRLCSFRGVVALGAAWKEVAPTFLGGHEYQAFIFRN